MSKEMWDGTGKIVQVEFNDKSHTLWVNIDGVCALRCTHIELCDVELPVSGSSQVATLLTERIVDGKT